MTILLLLPCCVQTVYVVSADIGSVAVKDSLADAVRSNGHVDVLVNCAGITHTATLQDTPSEKYEVHRLHSMVSHCNCSLLIYRDFGVLVEMYLVVMYA